MPPASARTRSPASGSSRVPARSPSTPAKSKSISRVTVLRMMIQQPIVAAARQGQYDVVCTVAGGGLSGQAGAVRHGISKALTNFEPDLRSVLKKGGFLTRDSRVVERKKYARRKPAGRSSSRSAKARFAAGSRSANSFVQIFRNRGDRQGRLRRPFWFQNAIELPRFFSKILWRPQTDCQDTAASFTGG